MRSVRCRSPLRPSITNEDQRTKHGNHRGDGHPLHAASEVSRGTAWGTARAAVRNQAQLSADEADGGSAYGNSDPETQDTEDVGAQI